MVMMRRGSPTWIAASPMPGASYMVASIWSMKRRVVVVDALHRQALLPQERIGKGEDFEVRHGARDIGAARQGVNRARAQTRQRRSVARSPPSAPVLQLHVAAMRAQDAARDGEAEAGTAGLAAARGFEPHEGLEDALEVGGRDSRAVVLDDNAHARRLRLDARRRARVP